MNKAIAKPWLSLQCQMIPGVSHAVFAADMTADKEFGTFETWPDGAKAPAEVMSVLTAAVESEGVEIMPSGDKSSPENTGSWIVACPLRRGGKVCGAAAVEVVGIEESQVPVVSRLMLWGSAWPAFLVDQESARLNAAPDESKLATEVLEAETLSVATTSVATKLAHLYSADRVSIGMLEEDRMQVAAISGRAVFDRRNDSIRLIEAAQNEALDQNRTVVWPSSPDAELVISTAHEHLSKDDQCACTVLLRAKGNVIGAVTLCRARKNTLEPEQIEQVEQMSATLGPAFESLRLANRSAVTRAHDSATKFKTQLFGSGHSGLKLICAGGLALLLFLSLATTTYEVSAPAVLEGTVERDLAAPVDGFINEAFVRAGARVKAGETLATLDDRPLQLERSRLQGQYAQLTNEYNRALGSLDHGATRVLAAQVSQAESQLELIEDQLTRTRIVAPFDALVVSGDLSQSLGSPVSRGDPLFRLAPQDGYRVILEVDESDVPAILAGAGGRLVLTALPGESMEFTVERMNGMTHSVDGSNVLEIEASLTGNPEHLRPGMKGVARVDAGEARWLWIWTHRVRERIRMWWWAVGPVA